MSPDRKTVSDWWREPIASIVLVFAGLAIICVEVWRDGAADSIGYTFGFMLVGLGATGRIQAWVMAPPKRGGDDDSPTSPPK